MTAAPVRSAPEARSGLEAWGRAALPAPTASRGLGLLGVIGPGAIILGLSIGSGEWLLGPAVFVKYGLSLLWVTTVAVFLQTIFNEELIRYTLYTGEPAVIGFMRTRPGAAFWGVLYALFYFLQWGWPAWAANAASALFFASRGRLVGPDDDAALFWVGAATYLVCVAALIVGRRIERTLEILNWFMILVLLAGLALLCLYFADAHRWAAGLAGFAGFDLESRSFSFLPPGGDWFLIAAFAAYSGAGGVAHLTLSNWARDKGFGMGQVVGFIPAAVGGAKVKLAHTGSVFEVTPESLRQWKSWWRIVRLDQWGVFFVGALIGMGLPALLYTALLPAGRDIRGPAIAAELAGAVATRSGATLAFFVALMGAWALFKTQLDNIEGMTRSLTDMVWTGSRRLRAWRGGDVRLVYYPILATGVVGGLIALRMTPPMILLLLSANMAGVVFVVASLHILYLNCTLLPRELRPPLWRRLALVALALFYGSFVYLWLMGGLVPDLEKGFLFNIPRYLHTGG
ncbi:MAG: Nramp family divalent metal transporter [Candidatus Acidiferrales bacterium]